MSQPRVAVVIVNWNGRDDTLACLDAVLESDYAERSVLVVDNGSEDGSAGAIRARFPSASVLETGRNLGFAAGNNVALDRLKHDPPGYVWLLNNDARPDPCALSALVALAEADPGLGAVGSVLVGLDGTIEAWGSGSVSFRSGLPRHNLAPTEPVDVDYLVGASLLLRWTALAAVGFFDDRYFLYWEDTDLCFRLREAGWRLGVAGDALVRHRGQASTGLRSPLWDREFTASSVLFFRRHARSAFPPIVVSTGGRLARRAIHGEWANVRSTWQGFTRALGWRDEIR
jgi:GT2 family glycosyltransferase